MASIARPVTVKDFAAAPFYLSVEQKKWFCDFKVNISTTAFPVIAKAGASQERSCLQKIKDAISYIWKLFLAIVTCGKKPFPGKGNEAATTSTPPVTSYTRTEEFVLKGEARESLGENLTPIFQYLIGDATTPSQNEDVAKECLEEFRKKCITKIGFIRLVAVKEVEHGNVTKLVLKVLQGLDRETKTESHQLKTFSIKGKDKEALRAELNSGGVYLPADDGARTLLLTTALEEIGVKSKISEIIQAIEENKPSKNASANGLTKVEIVTLQERVGAPLFMVGKKMLRVTTPVNRQIGEVILTRAFERGEVRRLINNHRHIQKKIALEGTEKNQVVVHGLVHERSREHEDYYLRIKEKTDVIGHKIFLEERILTV